MRALHVRHSPRRTDGFTLIELILVLIVLCVILAMAAPSLRGWGRASKLRDATRQLVATSHWARSEAIANATTYRLNLDIANGSYAVYRQNGTEFTPVDGDFGKSVALPSGFKMQIVSGGVDGNAIEFYPDSRGTPIVLQVVSPGGESSEIASNFPADLIHLVTDANGGGMR